LNVVLNLALAAIEELVHAARPERYLGVTISMARAFAYSTL